MRPGGGRAGYRGVDRRSPVVVVGAQPYVGPERRTRPAGPVRPWVPLLGIALLAAVVAAGATSTIRARTSDVALQDAADVLLLIAGTLQVLAWRVTGRAGPALTGAGFLIAGGLMLPLRPAAVLLHDDPLLRALAPGCALALGVAAAYLCVRSTRARPVVAALRPTREASALALAAFTAVALMGAIRSLNGPLDGVRSWMAGMGVLAAGWLMAAVAYARPAAASASEPDPGLAAVAAGLALGDALLVLGVDHHATVAAVGLAVQVLAAGGAALVGAAALERCFGQQGTRTLRLAGELSDTARLLAGEQAAREEMLHDARSTLAAIRLANGALSRDQQRLDGILAAELRESVGSELQRLEQLLADDHSREAVRFDLATALAPVARVARDAGLRLSVELAALPAVSGSPADTATVVHSLLTNAARYAGGSAVRISAWATPSVVEVTVADRGPGIAADEREAVFQRGVRGRSGAGQDGSGLGLFIARWLMSEQGGGLRVEARAGGGACFVLTLPRATVVTAPAAAGGSDGTLWATMPPPEPLALRGASPRG